jgi:two-component system chemotaxis sensor kinase CheA
VEDGELKVKGIIGSCILCGSIVLLINIYELFEMACPEHYKISSNEISTEMITILLVEDTPFFQKMEKYYLENAGYKVITAWNGKEALELLQEHNIDVVVSDINMPEINGLELVKRIRSDTRHSKLPVIAVTSLTGEKQKQEGIEAGFDAYEYKLDKVQLLEVIDKVLLERRAAI